MSMDAAIRNCPRPQPFDEVQQVLRDLAELEAALAMEIHRLSALRAPQQGGGRWATYLGKPLWWWRAMLISWVFAPATGEAHPTDVLQGLRHVVNGFSDGDLAAFLQQMPDDATSQEPSAA